jgi:hypothetical protein
MPPRSELQPHDMSTLVPVADTMSPPSAPGYPDNFPRQTMPSRGGSAPGQATSTDQLLQFYRRGRGIPQVRITPSPASAQAAIGSAAQAQALVVVAPVAAQTAANTVAIANLTNPSVFLGAWSSSASYVKSNQVTFSGSYYIAIADSTNQQPDVSPLFWQLVSSPSTENFLGQYNPATAYVPGNQVTSNGSFWICILNSTGNTPTVPSTFWTRVGTSAILIGAYSGATAYVTGNEVTNAGNIFQALQATTGNAPPTPPATNAFWQLIGPSDLGSLPDGSSRFAATGSTLTYRPLTNPLTATDAGSNATVNIASFVLRTSSKGDVNINSGSITALSYATLVYIYYDDATLSGGTVTFNATTTKTTALNGAGRFFIGSIVTPAATAPNTIGNSDGGVGAQSGQTAVFLFGAATASGVSGQGSVTGANNAIDGNLTSFATVAISSAGSAASNAALILSAASPSSAPWSSLTLFVRSAVTANTDTNLTPASMDYSLDGGVNFINIYTVAASTTRALTTDSITLPLNQNLALLRVQSSVSRNTGFAQVVTVHVHEAWVVGLQ